MTKNKTIEKVFTTEVNLSNLIANMGDSVNILLDSLIRLVVENTRKEMYAIVEEITAEDIERVYGDLDMMYDNDLIEVQLANTLILKRELEDIILSECIDIKTTVQTKVLANNLIALYIIKI